MERNSKQNDGFPRDFLKLLEQNPSRFLSAILIGELVKRGITQYYISPGHRNAPLMAAIHHHPLTHAKSIIDERSAGYRALGYASATEKCPALVCTSGTALANYLPALIEAWASELPLLILSADRTRQQVKAGENQTIPQPDIYGQFAPCLNISGWEEKPLSRLSQKLDDILQTRRPSHINIPLQEPLGSEQVPLKHSKKKDALALLTLPPPLRKKPQGGESAKLERLRKKIRQSRSLLVVVGEIKSTHQRRLLLPLLKQSSWPFHLDVTSGLKYQFHLDDGILPSFEHPEVPQHWHKEIDTILHVGGRVTSRSYYRFLQNNPHIKVFNLSTSSHLRDPALRTEEFLQCPPTEILSSLLRYPSPQPWDTSWAEEKIRMVSCGPLSFPQISKVMIESIPEDTPLFLGNSTTIRAFDNFLSFNLKKDIPIHYNRGVSGIEGHIASALGVAEGSGKTTTLVLGDVSFLHDMNSLSSLTDAHPGVIIVLINDGGGGIFNLLPIAKETEILPSMTTPHSLHFEHLAKQFDIPYSAASNSEELIRSYQFLQKRGKGLLEVTLNPSDNLEVYRRLKTLRSPDVLP